MKSKDLFEYYKLKQQESMSPVRIKAIRKIYKLTQIKFAELLGINYDTLRSWEGGYRHPSSPEYALLQLAEQKPEIFKSGLHTKFKQNLV